MMNMKHSTNAHLNLDQTIIQMQLYLGVLTLVMD